MKLKNNIPNLLDTDPAKFARQLDMSNHTAYKYAGAKSVEFFDEDSTVSIGTLIKMAKILNVSFYDLFEEMSEI